MKGIKCIACITALLATTVLSDLKPWREYVPQTIYHTMAENQTMWEVCARYAGLDQKSQSLNEFVYMVKSENGGKVIYQPGEIMKITVWRIKTNGKEEL